MGVRTGIRGRLTADERAFLDRLVAAVGPRLLAYVRRVYGMRDEAEDIAADAFCRAADNIAAVRASSKPELYLLTTARNLCRDRFRRTMVDRAGSLELSRRPIETADPVETAMGAEQVRFLSDAVVALPQALREVVVLRLSADLRFEDIAELLHIPLGTALSRMHSAVQRLRKAMRCVHDSTAG